MNEDKFDKKLENIDARFNNIDEKFNNLNQKLDIILGKINKLDPMEKLLNQMWVKVKEMDFEVGVIKDVLVTHVEKFAKHENIIDAHSAKLERLDVRVSVLESKDK